MKKNLVITFTLFLAFLVGCTSADKKQPVSTPAKKKVVEKNLIFDLDADLYEVHFDTVQRGWTLSHMLLPFGLNQYLINVADEKAHDSLVGLKYIVEGKPFTVFSTLEDTIRRVNYVIYEPDVFSYIIFDFNDSVVVTRKDRPISIERNLISGEIEQNSNLTVELNKNFDSYTMTAALAEAIEGVFAWKIDFFKLQAGDQFVVAYDEKKVDGISYGVDKISHILFKHKEKDKYAFRFMTDSLNGVYGYYDEEAREMKRPFLMAPVQFARISSGYNLNRLHPIYKRRKAHLGTDYAAPTGTPIMATGDGVVTKATRGGGNGIYVKIRHNSVFETQYLHMSKIADGIKPGVYVEQGQTIGYVGSTGAATGPHVCYRFWKNGKQVNHRAETFPDSQPMDSSLIPAYLTYIEPLKEELDRIRR